MYSVPDLTSITIVTVTFDELVQWNKEVDDKSDDEENVQNVSGIQLKLRFLREVRRAQLTVSRALRTTA
jgi:hypothetical protein